MHSDPENFDDLRRLLALKRHEQPPPGYFNHFSSQVIARIRAGERGEPASLISRLLVETTWWHRLAAALEARPAFAGATGAAICALLISGIVYSENAPLSAPGTLVAAEPGSSLTAATAMNDSMDQPQQFVASGTNSLVSPPGSLIDQLQLPKAQLVNFSLPGN